MPLPSRPAGLAAGSGAHPLALRIEDRLGEPRGLAALADDLDLEALRLAGDFLRHIAERDRGFGRMGIAPGGDPPSHLAVMPDRLVADRVRIRGIDLEGHEPELAAALPFLDCG